MVNERPDLYRKSAGQERTEQPGEAGEHKPTLAELTHAEKVEALHKSVEELNSIVSLKRSEIRNLEQEALSRTTQSASARAFSLVRDEKGNVMGRGDGEVLPDVHARINQAEHELKIAEEALHAKNNPETDEKEALRQLAGSVRTEIGQLEEEIKHPDAKRSDAFKERALLYDEKGNVVGRTKEEIPLDVEARYLDAEQRLRDVEKRLQANVQTPPEQITLPKETVPLPRPANDNRQTIVNEETPKGTGILNRLAHTRWSKRVGLGLAGLIGLGQPVAAAAESFFQETYAVAPKGETPLRAFAEKGEGGDKLFGKLKVSIEEHYKLKGGTPTAVEKFILKSDPHALSVAFGFARDGHNSLVYKGDSLEIDGGNLLAHHGNRTIPLTHVAPSQKTGFRIVGTFLPTPARIQHANVHHAVVHHRESPPAHIREQESAKTVRDVYAYEQQHGGLPGMGAKETFSGFLERMRDSKAIATAVPTAPPERAQTLEEFNRTHSPEGARSAPETQATARPQAPAPESVEPEPQKAAPAPGVQSLEDFNKAHSSE